MLSKADIRQLIRTRRREMPATGPCSVAELSSGLCARIEAMLEFQAAGTILSYSPMRGEVDVSLLDCGGKKVILADCDWQDIPVDEIEFAIIPGVAFAPLTTVHGEQAGPDDASGMGTELRNCMRLGRGGGYYDRLMPLLHCRTVAPAFSFQIYDSVPADSWDWPVDIVIIP